MSRALGGVTFGGAFGRLQIDHAADFSGTVAGLTGSQQILDFLDINPAQVAQPTFVGNSSGGTLHVTDGTHSANIALIGNYLASTFIPASDGHGGTAVHDPQNGVDQSGLALPHA